MYRTRMCAVSPHAHPAVGQQDKKDGEDDAVIDLDSGIRASPDAFIPFHLPPADGLRTAHEKHEDLMRCANRALAGAASRQRVRPLQSITII